MRGGSWWPECRAGPTGSTAPRTTSSSTLGQAPAPVPAGQVTRQLAPMATRTDLTGRTYKLEGFRFDGVVCDACVLRPQCVAARPGIGRTVRRHPQEALLQEARAGFTEKPSVHRIPPATGGGRTPIGPAGPVGHSSGKVLRACQDQIPTVPGRHRGQSDPVDGQNGSDR